MIEKNDVVGWGLADTAELSRVYRELHRELLRRQGEELGEVPGWTAANEMAKRAMAIAAIGKHTICLAGPRGVGKTAMRFWLSRVSPDLASYETWLCPCGVHGDPRVDCPCSPVEIAAFRQERWPDAEMWIEVPPTPTRDIMRGVGTPFEEFKRQCQPPEWVRPTRFGMSDEADCLMRAAVSELGISVEEHAALLRITATITWMGGSKTIMAADVAEAVNYRRPHT